MERDDGLDGTMGREKNIEGKKGVHFGYLQGCDWGVRYFRPGGGSSMRVGKVILAFLVTCAALVLTGVTYHGYCMDFGEYPYMNFSEISKGNYERRFEYVYRTLEGYGVGIFVADHVSRGDGQVLDIYCSDSVREVLQGEYLRREGTFRSLFGSPLTVRYHDLSLFTQRETITHVETPIYFLYDGDVGELAGIPWRNFLPQRGAEGVLREKLLLVRVAWGAAFGLLLFATVLECWLKGKEWFVRLCHGYPGSRLLAGHVAGELASLLLPGLLGLVLLRSYAVPWFGDAGLAWLAGGFLLLDLGIPCAAFLLMDHRKAAQGAKSSPGLLRFSYVLRVGVLAASILLLGRCARQFLELGSVLGAAGFYKEYEMYAHIDFVYQGEFDLDRDRELDAQFLRQHGDRHDAQRWGAFSKVRNLAGEETWMIEANGLARERLEGLLPECADVTFKEGRCYVFLPEQFALEKLPEEERNHLIMATADYTYVGEVPTGRFLFGEGTEIIPYRGGIETMAFFGDQDLFEDAGWCRDPVIIFTMVGNADMEERDASYFSSYAVKVTEEELKEIVRADERIRDYRYTDIYGVYRKAAAEFVQAGLALLSTAALVILLDVLLLRSIVRMEQEVNALEIALKKVMGSPFYVRYRGIVGTTLSAGALAVLAAELTSWRQAHRPDLLGAGVGVGLILLELCFVALEAFRWERVQVQKILKGGCVS